MFLSMVRILIFTLRYEICHISRQSACTAESTEYVSRISQMMETWFVLSRDMGENEAANLFISMTDKPDDVNVPDRYGKTLLCRAVWQNIMPAVKRILGRKEVIVNLGNGGHY